MSRLIRYLRGSVRFRLTGAAPEGTFTRGLYERGVE